MSATKGNPAALFPHDAAWLDTAAEHLRLIRDALADLPQAHRASYDHIGSTSVPDLAAKPYIDLQVRMLPLATEEELIARLRPLGFERARGSRPDSPGVYRDIPRGGEAVADEVWEKRIFVHDAGVILHIRRSDSPWGRYTVWFRDWLRADPSARGRYEAMKRAESLRNAGKADYDDYTRAKSAFFDEVQDEFTAWARAQRR